MEQERQDPMKGFHTQAVSAGDPPDPTTGSIGLPIYPTVMYAQPDMETFKEVINGKKKGFFYTRASNPTFQAVEAKIAALTQGERALVFASGMAAITSTFLALVSSGDHIVAFQDIYGGSFNFLKNELSRFQVETTFVETGDLKALEAALRPSTRVIYFETPTNPMLKVVDIEKIVEIGRRHKIVTVIDNTFASPFNQKPLTMGIDIEIHSGSKYLGGHSDILAGVVVGSQELMSRIQYIRYVYGGIPDPHTAWLLNRGIKTLGARMERHNHNGLQVARFLHNHPKVRKVFYPGLEDHPQHEIARKQMRGFGGMLSFEVSGGAEAEKVVRHLKLFHLAGSLGGVEGLVTIPAATSHRRMPREEREKLGITEGLIRLSVGIEDLEDVLEDLRQALEQV
jgi:cystathionine gamma-lyase/homocysteine desulfhydrase